MPAAREACRAGAWPSPAGSTQPMITSSTFATSTPAWASAPWMAALPSAGVGVPVNWPRKEPMAVRLAPTMTTSDISKLRWGRPGGLSADYGAIRTRMLHCRIPCGQGPGALHNGGEGPRTDAGAVNRGSTDAL